MLVKVLLGERGFRNIARDTNFFYKQNVQHTRRDEDPVVVTKHKNSVVPESRVSRG